MINELHTETVLNEFTPFDPEDIAGLAVPAVLNSPFEYIPDPLCRIAAAQLQRRLDRNRDWLKELKPADGTPSDGGGKMFGVLVVRDPHRGVGFLSAFSGLLCGQNRQPGFVPPVYDYLKHPAYTHNVNAQTEPVEQKTAVLELEEDSQSLNRKISFLEEQLAVERRRIKAAGEKRRGQRQKVKTENPSGYPAFVQEQSAERVRQQREFRDFKESIRREIAGLQCRLGEIKLELKKRQEKRRQRSRDLQQSLFSNFRFLNSRGDSVDLAALFRRWNGSLPPSGAGDCCAPRLLQYAFSNNLKPLAIAEFWWGRDSRSRIRRHGMFYPACKSKCEPILHYMLEGMNTLENKPEHSFDSDFSPEIIHRDRWLIAVNKPPGLLSVPGKSNAPSVFSLLQENNASPDGLFAVHRLDRDTSGLLLLTRDLDTYRSLQNQFTERTVHKRYTAVLDGTLPDTRGVVSLPLCPDPDNRPQQMVCFERGKPAKTRWETVAQVEGRTLVHLYPETGRTHQLRIHAAHPSGLNSPIRGDRLYGNAGKRLYLHADRLAFRHPGTGTAMELIMENDF